MEKELDQIIKEITEKNIKKAVLSNSKDTKYKKITVTKHSNGYQAEKFTDTQAFHENLSENQLALFCYQCMEEGFKQLNAWDDEFEYAIKISKKGKVFFNKSKCVTAVKTSNDNNRQKDYYLKEGTVIPPLVDMGVFTKDGKIVKSMYDKYRQINKFLQFIEEAIEKANLSKINIVDFGCGKSYLTFVVYYYLTFVKGLDVTMTGLDLKEDVIKK